MQLIGYFRGVCSRLYINGVFMGDARQKVLDAFWPEVLHRAKMLLSDMNLSRFYQWKETVSDREISRLLKLMELLIYPEKNSLETKFLIEMINTQLNGHTLFSCFKTSGKKIIKAGMKGDIYCMPVLYVLIRYLIDNENIVFMSSFERYPGQKVHLNQTYRFSPSKTCHTAGSQKNVTEK